MTADKVCIEYALDPCIFNEGVYDSIINSCSSVFAYGEIYRLTLRGGVATFLSTVNDVQIGTLMTDATFTGALTNCLVFEGFTGTVTGDRTNELIGYPAASPVDNTAAINAAQVRSIAISSALYLV
jgi:hypothetical protein